MAKLISQLYGELQPAVCFSRDMELFEDHPSTYGHLTSHSKSNLGNFHHQYLTKLLVNVYSSLDGEKCVLMLYAWKLAFLPVTYIVDRAM